MGGRPWTEAEKQTALEHRKTGMKFLEIGRLMGRSRRSVQEKVLESMLPFEQRRRPLSSGEMVGMAQRFAPPPQVLAEREYRLSQPRRDLTGVYMGDPPIGSSALDKRMVR